MQQQEPMYRQCRTLSLPHAVWRTLFQQTLTLKLWERRWDPWLGHPGQWSPLFGFHLGHTEGREKN